MTGSGRLDGILFLIIDLRASLATATVTATFLGVEYHHFESL